jgi:hypothetical protein
MTSDRKKPGVAFWTSVVVAVVLLAYPISFGPACWMADREMVAVSLVRDLYDPLVALIVAGPRPVQRMMFYYGEAGSPESVELDVRWRRCSWLIFGDAWMRRDGKA